MNPLKSVGIILMLSAICIVIAHVRHFRNQNTQLTLHRIFVAKDIKLGTLMFLFIFTFPMILSNPQNPLLDLNINNLNNVVSLGFLIIFGLFPLILWIFNLYSHTSSITLTDTSLIKSTLWGKTELLFTDIKQTKRFKPSFLQTRWCYRKTLIKGVHKNISFYWFWGEPGIFSLADTIECRINSAEKRVEIQT